MKHNTAYKPVIYLTIVLLLFYCSSLLIFIPVKLFNINLKECSAITYSLVRFFPNTVLAILLFFMYKKTIKNDLKDFFKNFGEKTDTAFKYWIIGFCLMVISNYIILLFSPVKTANNEESVRAILKATPIITMFFSCIVAPFIEELIFRKAFKDAINTKWVFILVSGIVFGSLHVVGNIKSIYDLCFIAPYSFLGLAFAATYYDTNNIFSSIFIHFFHNTLVILLAIFGIGVII